MGEKIAVDYYELPKLIRLEQPLYVDFCMDGGFRLAVGIDGFGNPMYNLFFQGDDYCHFTSGKHGAKADGRHVYRFPNDEVEGDTLKVEATPHEKMMESHAQQMVDMMHLCRDRYVEKHGVIEGRHRYQEFLNAGSRKSTHTRLIHSAPYTHRISSTHSRRVACKICIGTHIPSKVAQSICNTRFAPPPLPHRRKSTWPSSLAVNNRQQQKGVPDPTSAATHHRREMSEKVLGYETQVAEIIDAFCTGEGEPLEVMILLVGDVMKKHGCPDDKVPEAVAGLLDVLKLKDGEERTWATMQYLKDLETVDWTK